MSAYYLDTEFHEYAKKPYFGKFGKPINTIELISIGIVCEDGREYYAISKDFDIDAAWEDEWLRENVLFPIYTEHVHGDMRNHVLFTKRNLKGILKGFGKTDKEIAEEIKEFIYSEGKHYIHRKASEHNLWINEIKFHAYYADYDWVVFCQLFGRMIDLPKGFPMYCIDLKQECENVFRIDEEVVNSISVAQKIQGAFPTLSNITNGFRIGHEKLKLFQGYPEQENKHNALSDARWNLKLHKFLKSI